MEGSEVKIICYFPQAICYFAGIFGGNDALTQSLSKDVLREAPPSKGKQNGKFFEQKRLENIYYMLQLPLGDSQRILRELYLKCPEVKKISVFEHTVVLHVIQKNIL